MKKLTQEEYIAKAIEVQGNKYIYTDTIYRGIHEMIDIICPIHGKFQQEAGKHLYAKRGCPKCNGGIAKTKEEMVQKANDIHGYGTYSYDNFVYVNSKTIGEIHCNKCGNDFWMTMDHHTNKHHAQGCPICRCSHMERFVMNELKRLDIPYIYQANKNNLEWLKTKRGSYSLDFYFPQYSMAIECQGEQHFHSRENGIFTEDKVKIIKRRDAEKLNRCLEHNVIIEYINYNEDIEVILNNILNKYK